MSTLSRFKAFLYRATVTQWKVLEDEHQARDPASGRERAGVVGLYVLAMLLLIAIEYLPRDTYRALLRDDLPRELRRFGQDLWWCWFVILAYTVLPAIYCRTVLKLRLSELGLNAKGFLKHAWIYVGLFLLVLPFVIGVSGTETFQSKYPLFGRSSGADVHLNRFLVWEFSYALQFVALEFFFRGVLLFGAVRVLGPWAIIGMVTPYMMIHFGKPGAEAVGAILAGGGAWAHRSADQLDLRRDGHPHRCRLVNGSACALAQREAQRPLRLRHLTGSPLSLGL